MNKILEVILEMVNMKQAEKGLTLKQKEVLDDVELTLVAMASKVWTIEDADYINKQMELLKKKLQSIEEK